MSDQATISNSNEEAFAKGKGKADPTQELSMDEESESESENEIVSLQFLHAITSLILTSLRVTRLTMVCVPHCHPNNPCLNDRMRLTGHQLPPY